MGVDTSRCDGGERDTDSPWLRLTSSASPISSNLSAANCFVLHFVPKGASWLNLVERWFAEITSKLMRRGVRRSVADLEADIRSWLAHWNETRAPLRLGQDRRRDSRQPREILRTDL